MTEARFSSPNSPTATSKCAHRHLHWKRACLIKLTRVLVDDVVGDLCDRPGGSRMAVNSRILRVDQSFLLEDVLALVSWEDDVNRLASVQTGSDAGSRDTMRPEDDIQLLLEFWQMAFHLKFSKTRT